MDEGGTVTEIVVVVSLYELPTAATDISHLVTAAFALTLVVDAIGTERSTMGAPPSVADGDRFRSGRRTGQVLGRETNGTVGGRPGPDHRAVQVRVGTG